MKKHRHLELKRHTIRALQADELRAIDGAAKVQGACSDVKSGCNSGAMTVCFPYEPPVA